MEAASRGIKQMLEALTEESSVERALLKFTLQLESDYADTQDIALFVFALRSFFCWHRAPELAPESAKKVQDAWITQNEGIYAEWLSSSEDDPELLKWSKWTFQAKMSILKEFLDGAVAAAAKPEQSGTLSKVPVATETHAEYTRRRVPQ
jgi:hypothetical protein